jgi:hypothetical protein
MLMNAAELAGVPLVNPYRLILGTTVCAIIFSLTSYRMCTVFLAARGQDRTLTWSQTSGEIVSSIIDKYEPKSRRAQRKIRRRRFDFSVEYTYQVDGRSYTGTDWHHMYNKITGGQPQLHLDANREEMKILVCYDLADPSQAVLQQGRPLNYQGDSLVTEYVGNGSIALLTGLAAFGIPIHLWRQKNR